MADDFSLGIDASFADASSRRRRRPVRKPKPVAPEPPLVLDEPEVEADEDPISARIINAFLVLQFLGGALLFLPGAQLFRGPVRALPYLSALVPLGYYLSRRERTSKPVAAGLVTVSLLLLALNLLHPSTQLGAGIAQCIFQLAIAAPVFWAPSAVRSPRAMHRVLMLIFLFNVAGAVVGILQVYDPDRFLPAQFSAQLRDDYLMSLSYTGTDGRVITRPPGLSDVPGGAAVAGGLSAAIGLCLLFRTRNPLQAAGLLVAIGIGFAVIYLTQVRSILLMTVGSTAVIIALTLRRRQFTRVAGLLGVGGALLMASFLWASSLGGEAVDSRFLNLRGQGALTVYQQERGNFIAYTVGDLLDQYPFGAGLGRWGMMNAYFGDPYAYQSEPIHAEIQLTGWLLDGGFFMWFLYGGAIITALLMVFRLAGRRRDRDLGEAAVCVGAATVFVVGMSFAGPAFNTQLGVLFWFLVGALHGAEGTPWTRDPFAES